MASQKAEYAASWAIIGLIPLAMLAIVVTVALKGKKRVSGPPVPPLPIVAFESEGDTELTLASGSEFDVVWDPLSAWKHVAQGAGVVHAIDAGTEFIRFRVATSPPEGGERVTVRALDVNNNLMAEHKITVFGP